MYRGPLTEKEIGAVNRQQSISNMLKPSSSIQWHSVVSCCLDSPISSVPHEYLNVFGQPRLDMSSSRMWNS